MKSFLVSLSFLVFFLTAATVNCFYVTDILSDIDDKLCELPIIQGEEIPKEVSENAKKIPEYWNRHFRFLALSINTAELRDCGASLGNLAQFSESDTPADYNSALSEARIRIGVLYERERLTLANIF